MKTSLCALFALILSLNTFAGKGFDELFSKYSGSENITSINLTEKMISIASSFIGEEDKEAQALLDGIKSVKLLVAESGKTPDGLDEDVMKFISGEHYEELIRVNEEEDVVRVLVKEDKEIINDVLVYVTSEDEMVLINIRGSIDPEQVGKVLRSLDIEVDGLNME